MKKSVTYIIILLLCVSLCLSGCGYIHREVDPHEGMVEVFNGYSNVWIVPQEGVPVSTIRQEDFVLDPNGVKTYCGGEYAAVLHGIDVSSHQRDIDWKQVKDSGIDFAIIRVGGRYYSGEGEIYADELYEQNIQGALDAGLYVGAYFFSQAMNADEAREEAQYAVALLGNFELTMPVFFDWERIGNSQGRADNIDSETMTQCAVTFCETVKDAGFDAGVYYNLDTSYYGYDMAKLTDYTFWCAAPGDYPYCYYAQDMWQYSFEGQVPGINTNCDLDMLFVK